MQRQTQIIGVDVAKAQLVVAGHEQSGSAKVLANEAQCIGQWLLALPAGSIVAMEATGRYHRLMAQLAHAAGMKVYVLNARDVHFYAKALNGRSKTDRLDAALIARYAAEHHTRLRAWSPAAGVEHQVQDLLQRRARVSRVYAALRQTLSHIPSLRLPGQRLYEELERFLKELDRQVALLVSSDARLNQGVELIRTVPGFGPQGAAAFATLFKRLESGNADTVVAFTGLDPRACDSGEHRGKRRLSKRGPAWLRRQAYLAAFAASHSLLLKPLYESIKAKGFAPTQALVILARKLLRVAWAVWKSGAPFDPARLVPTSP